MKKLFISLLVVGITATSIFAQSAFDKDITAWHKKAVITCGLIKSPEASAKSEIIFKNLNELSNVLEAIAKKYKNNPPAEYKNDPLWASYFDDLADNLTVVKYFSGQHEYRVAGKNCSVFCKTILRMHKNNGTVDLPDMLFSLNMQLKLTTDISNAGNAKGAINNIDLVKEILEKASLKLKNSGNANLQTLFVPVEKSTREWIKAIEGSDAASAKALYTSFTPDFKKMFIASMQN